MQSALPDDLDLDWLHDSVVKGIVYEANAGGRNIASALFALTAARLTIH